MTPSETMLTDAVPALLAKLDRAGDYYGHGVEPLPVVRLDVSGVGTLGLPVPRVQAEALYAIAEEAPYGRGPQTLIDRDVRRCRQLDAGAVRAADARWSDVLQRIVAAAARALGVDGEVRAELYKLLVYAAGDFFVEHRDTEKAPGMFATLVVALPSPHDGGALVIRHEGREARVDLSGDDLGVARWAAFYADCSHALEPVREGHRVALVYNLTRAAKSLPRAPDASPVVTPLTSLLRAWDDTNDAPTKLVLPLAHQYTLAELSFAALKNGDAAAAQALLRAGEAAGCVVRLALLSITESGAAEPSWDGYSRRGRYRREEDEDDEDDDTPSYDVVSVEERRATLAQWRSPDGAPEDYGTLSVIEEEELAPRDALEHATPDTDHLAEAMGNGGASYERAYRHAALVVWPRAHEHAMIAAGGASASVAALQRYARADLPRAKEFAKALSAGWTPHTPREGNEEPLTARALVALRALGDDGLVGAFLERAGAVGDLDAGERDAVADAVAALPAAAAARCAEKLAVDAEARRFEAGAALLRRIVEARSDEAMRAPITALAEATRGWRDAAHLLRSHVEQRVKGAVDLLCAAHRTGGSALVREVCARALSNRAAFPLDAALVPLARALRGEDGAPTRDGLQPIFDDIMAHLSARLALPLAAPTDAARETSGLTCTCADCRELGQFLLSEKSLRWRFKAAQPRRSHVESVATSAGVDVRMFTERGGSPLTLVCDKTAARYEARVRQRADDAAAPRVIAAW